MSLFLSRFCGTISGGRWFVLCTGGKDRVCTSCDFDLNLCEKKWRGLRYGNFHVGGVNGGNYLCVSS